MAKSKKLVKPRVQRKPRGKTTKKMNRKNPVNKLTKRKPYKKVAKRKTHKKKGGGKKETPTIFTDFYNDLNPYLRAIKIYIDNYEFLSHLSEEDRNEMRNVKDNFENILSELKFKKFEENLLTTYEK